MARYVLELYLADRPGSLGRVAVCLGEHGGDVTDVDILEHGERARLEITVELSEDETEGLNTALEALEGVEVEHLSLLGEFAPHLVVDGLEVAAALTAESSRDGVLEALVHGVVAAYGVERVVATGPDGSVWGAGAKAPVPGEVATVALGEGFELEVSTGSRQLRNREQRELTTLGRIAATRLDELRALD